MIRKAVMADLNQVEQGFVERLEYQQTHTAYTGWKLHVYPTRATAEQALSAGTLYVMEQEGEIAASMIASQNQPAKFRDIPWRYPARDDEVLVLHLLCVRPSHARQGIGQAMVRHFMQEARSLHCKTVRLDTGEPNTPAQALYTKLGFECAGLRNHFLFFERKVEVPRKISPV